MPQVFNSALEIGLRSLFVLASAPNRNLDLQRLAVYDYLLVHSGDAGGPSSLHPATPNRSGELLVKRDILRAGLLLFAGKGLVTVRFGSEGISYQVTGAGEIFLSYLNDAYSDSLRRCAAWIHAHFGEWPWEELNTYVTRHLNKWGGEFVGESLAVPSRLAE